MSLIEERERLVRQLEVWCLPQSGGRGEMRCAGGMGICNNKVFHEGEIRFSNDVILDRV